MFSAGIVPMSSQRRSNTYSIPRTRIRLYCIRETDGIRRNIAARKNAAYRIRRDDGMPIQVRTATSPPAAATTKTSREKRGSCPRSRRILTAFTMLNCACSSRLPKYASLPVSFTSRIAAKLWFMVRVDSPFAAKSFFEAASRMRLKSLWKISTTVPQTRKETSATFGTSTKITASTARNTTASESASRAGISRTSATSRICMMRPISSDEPCSR